MRFGVGLLALLLVGCQAAEERQRDLLGLYLEQPSRLSAIAIDARWGEPQRAPERAARRWRELALAWSEERASARLLERTQQELAEAETIRGAATTRDDVRAALDVLIKGGVLGLPTRVGGGMPGEQQDVIRVRLVGDEGPLELNRVLPLPDKQGQAARQRAALEEVWQTAFPVVDAQVSEALRRFGERERALRQRIARLRQRLDDAEFEAAMSGGRPPELGPRVTLERAERSLTEHARRFVRRLVPVDPDRPDGRRRLLDDRTVAALEDGRALEAVGALLDAVAADLSAGE